MKQFIKKGNFFVFFLVLSIIFSDTAFANVLATTSYQTEQTTATSDNATVSNGTISDGIIIEPTDSDIVIDISENEVNESDISENVVSENAVSENTISENTVSDNTISENMISANEVSDGDYSEAMKEVKDELAKVLAQKEIMALVYLQDTYEVKERPISVSDNAAGIENPTVAWVPSAQTVFIKDVELSDYAFWMKVDFIMDEQEHTGYILLDNLAYSDELLIAWFDQYVTPLHDQMEKDLAFLAQVETGKQLSEDVPFDATGIASISGNSVSSNSLVTTKQSISANTMKKLKEFESADTSAYSMYNNVFGESSIVKTASKDGDTQWADVNQFPTDYQVKLNTLKTAHPDWKFVPMKITGFTFNQLVAEELKNDRSLIDSSAPDIFKGTHYGGTWYRATSQAIDYYAKPINFLSLQGIFQFEQLTYNSSYQNADSVQTILNNTFMSGTIPGTGTYYRDEFVKNGYDNNISPIHLASRVRQEQGTSGSAMVSGTYSGYQNLFNYYNIGASGTGDAAIRNSLTYARNQGWTTRQAAMRGGAKIIADGYVRQGQDTVYLQKWDLVAPYCTHQYMQNIAAPNSEASTTYTTYSNKGLLNKSFTFKIPVFQKSYKLSETKLTKPRGVKYRLMAYENGKQIDYSKLTFSSTKPSVATVDAEGWVTAVNIANPGVQPGKVGTATINVNKKDGSMPTLTCSVTVTAPLNKITLTETEGFFLVGDQESVTVEYDPIDTTTDPTVTWSTSNKKIATVVGTSFFKSQGNITGVGVVGEKNQATITAKVGTKTAKYIANVVIPLKAVQMSVSSANLYSGASEKLIVNYAPVNSTNDKTITWSSSDESVVTVQNGTIKGISEGTATITAKMYSIDQHGHKDEMITTCRVTVRDCDVKFYNLDGTLDSTTSITYGTAIPSEEFPEPALIDNYDFVGWFTERSALDDAICAGLQYTEESLIRKDVSLYPFYMPTDRGFFIKSVGDQVYTGALLKPEPLVYDKDGLLKKGIDYTVTYKRNKVVNDAEKPTTAPTIVIKGKGNYSGTQTTNFRIVPKDISDSDILIDDLKVAYTGKTQKLTPVVYRDGKKLKKTTDFTVLYPKTENGSYLNSGTYPVVITGVKNYTGTRTIYLQITPDTLIAKTTLKAIPKQTYTGSPITPAITLKKGTKQLTLGTDYTVEYSNNTEIGTASVKITGIGAYDGTRTTTFKIVGTSIAYAKINGITNFDYDGRDSYEQTNYTVTVGDASLQKDRDFTVSYLKNTGKGTATMVLTGINKYSGVRKKTFLIKPFNINTNLGGRFEDQSGELIVEYQKGATKPLPTLIFKTFDETEYPMELGKDYTLSYKRNTKINDGSDPTKMPTILVKGKGNFTGTNSTTTFIITGSTFTDENISMTAKDLVYKNKKDNYKSVPVLKDKRVNKVLKANTDYEKAFIYSYETDTDVINNSVPESRSAGDVVVPGDIVPAGTLMKVTVTGKGNYEADELSTTFHITQQSITGATVTIPKKYYIDDKTPITIDPTAVPAEITVKVAGRVLTPNVDYEIIEDSYTKNTKVGTASVTLRGLGNYGGLKLKSFTIAKKGIVWWWNITNN